MSVGNLSVLVCYPPFGSVWVNDAEWNGDFVEGFVFDDSDRGNPYLPDDYWGENIWMNFPLSCVVKVRAERSSGGDS